jgi:SAM-dependent methyltransferase
MTTESSIAGTCRACRSGLRKVLEIPRAPLNVQRLSHGDAQPAEETFRLVLGCCEVCGLTQLADIPEVPNRYGGDYLCSVAFSPHLKEYQGALAKRWTESYPSAFGSVLEVGGGDGHFACLLEQYGAKVTTVDPAPAACRIARGRGITRVVEGFLTPETFPGERFDAVIARHVLEHVRQPVEFLDLLGRHLGPGGILFLEVPNLDAIVARERFQDFYAEHPLYFDPASLARTVQQSGLAVQEMYLIENGDYLVCSARRTEIDLESFAKDLDRMRSRIREMVLDSVRRGRRVAVWGAGGRGVSLLTLIDAASLGIEYVVDSDRTKWGMLTPVTRLKVVSPEALRSNPVDDLIVIATSYQSEILAQLSWFHGEGRRIGVPDPPPRWLNPPGKNP